MTDPDTALNPEPGPSPPKGKSPWEQFVLILVALMFLLVVTCFSVADTDWALPVALLTVLLIATVSLFGLIALVSGSNKPPPESGA